ncbi:MAG: hypothetical protein JF614_13145 [Acidobacteria bacterium]|nr:hypothetical protein [Acidobacteriota bacterium]
MSKETTDAGKKGDWGGLLATMAANSADLAHLEPLRAQLATQFDKAVDIGKQQAGLIANKQEMSKQLRAVITEGNRLATLLRSAIKQHYGIRAEKVAEFGVQPFRGRTRKAKTPGTPPPSTTPPPPVPAGTATK